MKSPLGGFHSITTMHDFTDLFKEQLVSEKPLTSGGINSILSILAYNKTPREIMVESKKLKTKIGVRRMLYYVTNKTADGSALKPKMEKVWEDEFADLQTKLTDYAFTGYEGQIPHFTHKDIK
jgi:hypothetical protein